MLTDNISAKTWTVFLKGYVIVEVQRIPGASTQMQPIDDLSRNRIPTGMKILHFESKSIMNFSIKCSHYAA